MAIEPTIQSASQAAAGPASSPASSLAKAAATGGAFSFRSLLSDLNPLQYIPVVGSIYRTITGDEGNPTLRFVASLGTSFAMGGPLGLGITVAEKVTGIDPEKIGRHLLSGLLHPSGTAASATATAAPAAGAAAGATAAASASRPWTVAELSAYGVRTAQDGELAAGALGSADVLNTLELHRLGSATYA